MDQASKRIIILIDRYLPILGGAQNNVHQVARGLVREGLHVTVLTRIVFPGLQRKESIDGVQIRRFSGSSSRIFSKAGCIIGIVRYLLENKNNYDAVLCVPCVYLTDLLPAYFASRLTRKPYVMRTTGLFDYENLLEFHPRSFPDVLKKFLLPPLLWRKVLKNTSNIINQSTAILARGRQYGLDSMLVIPNGVDTGRFHSVNQADVLLIRQSLDIPKTKIVVTNTGRYVDGKNQISLLKVARELIVEGHKEIFILLLGATEEGQVEDTREQLVKFVQTNGLEDDVRFIDNADNVDAYLQASDIFGFTTRYREGMSNSLLEAMATGLPIVASRMEQITCMLPEKYPYLFDPECNDELKEQLSDLVISKRRRHEIAEMIETHTRENYSLATTIIRYKSVFLDL